MLFRSAKQEVAGVVVAFLNSHSQQFLQREIAALRETLPEGAPGIFHQLFRTYADDLFQIGCVGLMKAVDSFRPEYGNKFATYAIRCVDNELLMHLRSKKKQRKEVSMLEPIGTDKEGNQIQLVDVLEFHDKNVADEVTKREQMKKICTFMNDVLSEREAFIIRRRYGIGGNQELTQREIARALGISRSYVSRIEKRALEKLKKVISE